MKEVKVGQTIQFQNGERFKIDKVFPGNIVDMTEIEPHYPDILPNFRQTFYSIQLQNFEIVEE